jgi:Putative zinc- or iron-chelating domain
VEHLAIAAASASIRPLSVEQNLGAITHLMLPQGIALPPPQAQSYLRDIAETARMRVRQSLIASSAGGNAIAVLAAIGALGAELAGFYEAELDRQRAIDVALVESLATVECRKGCSFCCRLRVTATPLEVVRIAATLDDARRTNVVTTAEMVAGWSGRERLARQVPCPLLLEGACSTYEVRPLTCRALLSRSAALCERQFQVGVIAGDAAGVPSPVAPRLIAAALLNGQIAALRDLGLASHTVELIAALATLTRDPTVFARWLSREDVFGRA